MLYRSPPQPAQRMPCHASRFCAGCCARAVPGMEASAPLGRPATAIGMPTAEVRFGAAPEIAPVDDIAFDFMFDPLTAHQLRVLSVQKVRRRREGRHARSVRRLALPPASGSRQPQTQLLPWHECSPPHFHLRREFQWMLNPRC